MDKESDIESPTPENLPHRETAQMDKVLVAKTLLKLHLQSTFW
jgi:hypothetical protein